MKYSSALRSIHSGRIASVLEAIAGRLLKSAVTISADERWDDGKFFSSGLTRYVLFSRFGMRFCILLLVVCGSLVGLLAPWWQKLFIDGLLKQGVQADFVTLSLYVTYAFGAMIVAQLIGGVVRLLCSREASHMQAELSRALYRHTIQLTTEAKSGRTVGDTVNLYAQDSAAVVSLLDEFLPGVIMSTVPLIVGPIFISALLDIPLLTVLSTSLGFLVVLSLMSWRQSGFFSAFKRLAGERLAIVNEWLQNIRIIRILGWMPHFESKIFVKREEETQNRIGMVTNGSTMNSISQVAPLVINVAGISALVGYKQGAVSPGDIFALLWVFGVFLSRPLRNVPWALVMFLDGFTSAKRLEKFFRLPAELEPEKATEHESAHQMLMRNRTSPAIEVKNLSLTLGGKKILDQVSFSAPAGSFTVITGEVGSGKTQLLLALMRDCPAVFDTFTIDKNDARTLDLSVLRRHFAYVPQDGFVMSGTLRENVAFSYGASESLDTDILRGLGLADFRMDEEVQSGLATEIGERGVNLSGGQRQRVGLARGWFHQAGVVLLDDCLSAVDIETEKTLVDRLLNGAWGNKTRILVTHRLSVLKHADQVLVMENGRLRRDHTHE